MTVKYNSLKKKCVKCGKWMKHERKNAFLSSGEVRFLVHYTCKCGHETYVKIEL